jgi:hypothetical protein
MLKKGFLFFTLFFSTIALSTTELKPFTSDGCSLFPDGTVEQQELWLTCCVAHDFDYWQGGSATQRERSDARLKQCVKEVGEPIIASMMLAGVRVGGSPYLPTPFRWGYGWPYPRGYKVLSESERQQVENTARNVKLEQYFMPKTKKQ